MSPELIAIVTIGVSLGGGQLATVLWVAGRFERVAGEMAGLRERFARLEGLLEGLRDVVDGRSARLGATPGSPTGC